MEENRSFDHIFGFYPGVNGLTGNEWNAINTSDPNSQKYYVDKKAPYVAPCDPNHATYGTTYKIFGQDAISKNDYSKANMNGFVEFERAINGPGACSVMSMFTPDKLPVITTLAQEFALFDRFFCSHAGPTWPNRMYAISATSAGSTETSCWYRNQVGKLFPQKTIFHQIAEANLTWKNYYNDTPWELFMEILAHQPENTASMTQFFKDAAEGNLPNYAWINPRSGINYTTGLGSNDMHPDHDMALGEQFYKDIYEALRASPQWNETLFIITFDEHGGFYDHVPTPLNVPPPGDGESSYPETGIKFDRLGIRIPTLLISPWIKKGTIISAPPPAQKPFPNSEYELTSIISTTRKILGMKEEPLTQRDAWAATFEHILSMKEPRTDCPEHLPEAPPPTRTFEEKMAPNELQKNIMTVISQLTVKPYPHHIKQQGHVSEWNFNHFQEHVSLTSEWKKSKLDDSLKVVCQPTGSRNWAESSWSVNSAEGITWGTISTKHLNLDSKHYCIDSGDAQPNTKISVSLCYPTSDPAKNRDPSQHWNLMPDATLRPYKNLTLCATNAEYQGDFSVTLIPCKDKVEQKWAYHGTVVGDSGGGALYFGDDTNSLGLITSSSF